MSFSLGIIILIDNYWFNINFIYDWDVKLSKATGLKRICIKKEW